LLLWGLETGLSHFWIRLSRFTPILWQECESPYKNRGSFPEITKEGSYHVLSIDHNCNASKTRISAIFIMGNLPDIISFLIPYQAVLHPIKNRYKSLSM
jgi:hypothetical protein